MDQTHDAGVYRLHCPATGHNYIGATTNLEQRRDTHFNSLKRGWHNTVKLRSAAREYGATGFTWEVLGSFPLAFDAAWVARMLRLGERQRHQHFYAAAPHLLASASNISFNLKVSIPWFAPLDVVKPIIWDWEDRYGLLYPGKMMPYSRPPNRCRHLHTEVREEIIVTVVSTWDGKRNRDEDKTRRHSGVRLVSCLDCGHQSRIGPGEDTSGWGDPLIRNLSEAVPN